MFTRGVTSTIWIRLLDHMHFSTSSVHRDENSWNRKLGANGSSPKVFTSSHFKTTKLPFYDVKPERLWSGNLRPNRANECCKRRFLLHHHCIMWPVFRPCSIYQPVKDKNLKKCARVQALTCTRSYKNSYNFNHSLMVRSHKLRHLF